MKKIWLGLVIFSFILAFSGPISASENGVETEAEMEKISSPAEIKNFRDIKKEGMALFGIRKEKKVENGKNEVKASSSELEKISHPGEISLFEKIKKIGAALFGVRKVAVVKKAMIKPEAATCVATAIDKKDGALKTMISSSSEKHIIALGARTDCQKDVLNKTTAQEQVDANKVCVKTFNDGIKAINDAREKARISAWEAYKVDLKECTKLQAPVATSTTVSQSLTPEQIILEDGENEASAIK
jgi:hypothetical protein